MSALVWVTQGWSLTHKFITTLYSIVTQLVNIVGGLETIVFTYGGCLL